MTEQLSGIGDLFYADHRHWGRVRYWIDYAAPTTERLGRIVGHLTVLDSAQSGPMGFFDIVNAGSTAALRLEDGRWWLCNVINTAGACNNRGGLFAPGEQPDR